MRVRERESRTKHRSVNEPTLRKGRKEQKKSVLFSVTSKKSPNVYKSCPNMISLEKLKILTPLQKLPKNLGDLGKLIVA